jgi:FMN-dependent NADH-azoreductase
MKLLHLDSSILGAASVSRDLSARIVSRLAGPGVQVTYRDLAAENLAHVTPATIPAAHPLSPMAGRLDPAAQRIRDESERILEEFLAADVVVIGTPMYNFTIPSQLKTWIDRIIVPGTTVRYTASGPEGLVGGKRVIVALSRGGNYGSDAAAGEFAEHYLRFVLGFIGITAPEFVIADGMTRGDAAKADGLATAAQSLERLAA